MVVTSEFVIGTREIIKNIKSGKVKSVIAASNCPDFIKEKVKKAGMQVQEFKGNQIQLGTKLGKPFPIAVAGLFEEKS